LLDEKDGLGDTVDADGELIDDQVGDDRAGRLVSSDIDDTTTRCDGHDYWARDVGIDGGAATAEQATVHVVPDTIEDAIELLRDRVPDASTP
jgi:hypothetical protein